MTKNEQVIVALVTKVKDDINTYLRTNFEASICVFDDTIYELYLEDGKHKFNAPNTIHPNYSEKRLYAELLYAITFNKEYQ